MAFKEVMPSIIRVVITTSELTIITDNATFLDTDLKNKAITIGMNKVPESSAYAKSSANTMFCSSEAINIPTTPIPNTANRVKRILFFSVFIFFKGDIISFIKTVEAAINVPDAVDIAAEIAAASVIPISPVGSIVTIRVGKACCGSIRLGIRTLAKVPMSAPDIPYITQ
nr:hypothetical protein [Oceanobacillus sp. AG]